MRFALIILFVYLLINMVGSALADLHGLELPEIDPSLPPGMYLDFSEGYPNHLNPQQIPDARDPSNALPCDGYLTSSPSENFCSETVPNDWTAFEFNGEVFYHVPLNNGFGHNK